MLKRLRLDFEAQRKAQRNIQTLTSLRLVGRSSTWVELLDDGEEGKKAAWKKETLLAILSCKKNVDQLPSQLEEAKWCEYLTGHHGKKKQELALDPEIFLTRSHRAEFRNHYAYTNIPDMLRWFEEFAALDQRLESNHEQSIRIRKVMVSIVSELPEVFFQAFCPIAPCRWETIARAYLLSDNLVLCHVWPRVF